jgi:hypothetical protein
VRRPVLRTRLPRLAVNSGGTAGREWGEIAGRRFAVSQQDHAFEALLLHLKETRGFDFTGYKRSSLTRRVNSRMAHVGLSSYTEYVDYLEVHPDEFTVLFNTILINVTAFFRDSDAWDHLATEVLPGLLATKGPSDGSNSSMERRLRVRRGGLHLGHPARRAVGLRRVPGTGQDLRH